jgi:hypothetical protein
LVGQCPAQSATGKRLPSRLTTAVSTCRRSRDQGFRGDWLGDRHLEIPDPGLGLLIGSRAITVPKDRLGRRLSPRLCETGRFFPQFLENAT